VTVPAPDGPAGRVAAFGDRSFLVETADMAAAHALAAHLEELVAAGVAPGSVDEVVVGFACVLVVLDPDPARADAGAIAPWLRGMTAAPPVDASAHSAPREHVLPVVFDGDDLADVAAALGSSVEHVVALLVGAELEVAFVGFAPGFPYLTGLPPELAALPRRAPPRTSVPAGSVAVAAGFAAIYPRATPGGWHLLGRTTETLFDAVPGIALWLGTTLIAGDYYRAVGRPWGRSLLSDQQFGGIVLWGIGELVGVPLLMLVVMVRVGPHGRTS